MRQKRTNSNPQEEGQALLCGTVAVVDGGGWG